MTFSSTSQLAQPLPAHEHALLGFSLRLHLLYRSLLRATLQPAGEATCWTECAAEAVNDLHRDFVVLTRARLERPFAAMHGQEMRRWENHLAGIIQRCDIEDACSTDLLDEMKGIIESGGALLPFLENGTANEIALMLSRYRRAVTRLEAARSVGEAKIFFLRAAGEPGPRDWDEVLRAIRNEQGGEYAPVKRGSWRCLETALADVAETLPVVAAVPSRLAAGAASDPVGIPGRHLGVVGFSLTVRDRSPR